MSSQKRFKITSSNLLYFIARMLSIFLSVVLSMMSGPMIKTILENSGQTFVKDNISMVYFALALFLIYIFNAAISLLFDQVKSDTQKEQFEGVKTEIANLKGSIENNLGVTYVGSADRVFENIQSKIVGASSIYNTLIGMSFLDRYEKGVEEVYRSFFRYNDNAIWRDILSVPELFSGRFNMNLDEKVVKNRHKIHILRHSVPIINYTLIFKNNAPKCIFFGWGSRREASEMQIFYSEDQNILELFRNHFEVLLNDKTIDNGETSVRYDCTQEGRLGGVDIVDKIGRWFTIAYFPKKDSEGSFDIESYGIVDIYIDENARLNVSGDIYNEDFTYKSEVDSYSVYQTINQVIFEYRFDKLIRRRLGFCVYNFRIKNVVVGTASGKIDLLEGFFVNDQARIRKDLIGIRISNEFKSLPSSRALQYAIKKYKSTLENNINMKIS